MRLVANFTRHVIARGSPDKPCAMQLPSLAGEHATNVFGYALRDGCRLRIDVLQGMFGIGFWRGDVDETRLSGLAHAAPPYLRFSADDLLLATEMQSGRPLVQRWLVPLPLPHLLADQARVRRLNGGSFRCRARRGTWRGRSQLTTHYQLSVLWLQRAFVAWTHVDLSGIDVGEVRERCGWAEL